MYKAYYGITLALEKTLMINNLKTQLLNIRYIFDYSEYSAEDSDFSFFFSSNRIRADFCDYSEYSEFSEYSAHIF